VIDVGANRGQFVSELRTLYDGEIISFEPVTSAFAALTHAANLDSNWRVQKLALGSQPSFKKIHVTSYSAMSSFLTTNEYCAKAFGDNSRVVDDETVEIRRLDQVLGELIAGTKNRRIFLKMDTQGYDLEVFAGLGDFAKNVLMLQSEVSVIPLYNEMPHWTNSIHFFEKSGYGVSGLFPVNVDDFRAIEFDCLMVRNKN
jgi:FkbM family methyltransferase